MISVPSVDELRTNLGKVPGLPLDAAETLVSQCNAAIVSYETLREALQLRLASAATTRGDDGEHLIGTGDVARMLGRSESWVEHHLDELPPRRSLLGSPVWLKRDVERWIKNLPQYGKYIRSTS